jgi:hypothetical protein
MQAVLHQTKLIRCCVAIRSRSRNVLKLIPSQGETVLITACIDAAALCHPF